MGIKDFFKIKNTNINSDFNDKVISEMGRTVQLKDFAGIRICLDASMMIYQSILAMEKINALTDAEGNTTAHINTIFNKIIMLAQANIQQVWIFDSPHPNDMKKIEIEKRKLKKETMKKNGYEVYTINEPHIKDIQFLLENMGIMYFIAPEGIEAEQYGAKLTSGPSEQRFCKYMMSGDSDVLFFGGNLLRMLSEKSSTGKSKKTVYQIYELNDILNELGMEYNDFVKMGIVLGSDFNDKAPNIGPVAVMKKYKNAYLTPTMENAIKYYKSDISDKITEAKLVEGKYDKNEIMKFLESKNFNTKRVLERLETYEKTF